MDTLEFDEKVICGPEFVALRIIENCDDMKSGNIWLPSIIGQNQRLAFCQIENVGSTAATEYGLNIGDYVLIDRLSTFAHTAPVCLCKYNNVICKTNKDQSNFKPVRNMVFVEPEKKDDDLQVNGIYVSKDYDEKLNIGVITDMNCDDDLNLPFKTGDRVLVTKGGDVVEFGSTILHIYKYNMLICKIENEENEENEYI